MTDESVTTSLRKLPSGKLASLLHELAEPPATGAMSAALFVLATHPETRALQPGSTRTGNPKGAQKHERSNHQVTRPRGLRRADLFCFRGGTD